MNLNAGSSARFATTQGSLVLAAGNRGAPDAEEALVASPNADRALGLGGIGSGGHAARGEEGGETKMTSFGAVWLIIGSADVSCSQVSRS